MKCAMVGPTNSSGHNFGDDNTCKLTGAGDSQSGANPQLGALGANGRPTATRLPLTGSPFRSDFEGGLWGGDVLAGFAVTTDQRGVTRPEFEGCDVGSVEVAPEPPVPPGPGPRACGCRYPVKRGVAATAPPVHLVRPAGEPGFGAKTLVARACTAYGMG